MAWKGRTSQMDDPNRLRTLLTESKINVSNPPLFQGMSGLLNLLDQVKSGLSDKFGINDKLDLVNNVKSILPTSNGGSFSGIYQPIGRLVTNLDGVGCDPTMYTRVGDVVTVSGLFTVNPTAAGLCEGNISLPIKTYPIWDYQLAGVASAIDNIDHAGIYADIVNLEARFSWIASVTSQYKMFFTFSYMIIQE